VVQRTFGHSQGSLTMNTYVHIFPEVQKSAVDAMERLLGGTRAARAVGVRGFNRPRIPPARLPPYPHGPSRTKAT
jgi:hypothetical protein